MDLLHVSNAARELPAPAYERVKKIHAAMSAIEKTKSKVRSGGSLAALLCLVGWIIFLLLMAAKVITISVSTDTLAASVMIVLMGSLLVSFGVGMLIQRLRLGSQLAEAKAALVRMYAEDPDRQAFWFALHYIHTFKPALVRSNAKYITSDWRNYLNTVPIMYAARTSRSAS